MQGLLFKTAPATGAKTVQGFLVNTCAYHTSISKSARVAFQNCACHRSKNSARVSCEHLRPPDFHFKECTGCFSKLCLPQIQKQGFLVNTLAPTTRPFQRVHGECTGCFSKLRLPQVQKQCKGSPENLRLPHVHLKECRGCFSNTAPATVQFKQCRGFS